MMSNISNGGGGGSATPNFPVNAQTASYSATAADFATASLITVSSASATTLTLLAAAPAAGQNIQVENRGTATVTVARNGLNIDGAATNLTVYPNQGLFIASDGANYFTSRGGVGSLALIPTAVQTVQSPAGTSVQTVFKQDSSLTAGIWFLVQSGAGQSMITGGTSGPTLTTQLQFAYLGEQAALTGLSNLDALYGDGTTHTITHNSNNNGVMSFSGAWVSTNVTPVTAAASTTADQNLMSVSVPAGTLNRVGRSLRVWCSGVFSTPAAQTEIITFKVKLGTLTLVSIPVPSQSFTATNNQFNISTMLSVQTGGASGVFESHGNLVVDLGVGNLVADSVFADQNTAVSSTLDLTAAQTLQITVSASVASTSNSFTQRQMISETIG